MKYYKVLGEGGISCNGGTGKWSLPRDGQPGDWMPKIETVIPCRSGYHLCRRQDIISWLNEEIYEAEGRGKFIRHDNNKDVFPEARLVKKVENWNEKSARLFAADCAEHVLPIFKKHYPNDDRPRKAIQAARDFAMGKITRTKMDAAWNAAWAAERDTAWDAEKHWQTERLFSYLDDKKEP